MELNYDDDDDNDEIPTNQTNRNVTIQSEEKEIEELSPHIENKETNEEEEEEIDVDEFIRNYRDKLEGAAAQKKSDTTPPKATIIEREEDDEPSPLIESEPEKPTSPEQPKKAANPRKKVTNIAVNNDTETPVNNRLLSSVRDQERPNVEITPMPNYQGMNTPNLKVELKKYGIKALPKRQAILKLTEIYEYTHRHKLASLPRSHSFNNLNQIGNEKGSKILLN